MNLTLTFKVRLILACLFGCLAPLSFSPIDIWPLGILSILGLFASLQNSSPKQAAQTGFSYGLGFFGVGASWIFVSINVYSGAPMFVAVLLTSLFVAGLALLFSLQSWIYQRFFNKLLPVLTFACVWVLFEWLRSWLFAGFPWLYMGYAHINTPLAGLAPIFGVIGLSFVIAFTGACLFRLYQLYQTNKTLKTSHHYKLIAAVLSLWLLSPLLSTITWVQEEPWKDVQVGLVQANIDQNQKFDREFLERSLDLHVELTEPLWKGDIVIWPETAIPLVYQDSDYLLEAYSAIAKQNNSTLITGIFSEDFANEELVTYNSITSLGNGEGLYHKQKMVPFGEYIPLRNIFGSIFRVFNLPMSSLKPGPDNQTQLSANGLLLAPFICYEVVYPDFVRRHAIEADFLITISNDIWFGASFGPLQHLQMASMRALENGRYMVRATSGGVSAIINEKGKILSRTEQFEEAVLSGEVKVFSGRTPFSYWGSYPVILFSALVLLLIFLRTQQRALPTKAQE